MMLKSYLKNYRPHSVRHKFYSAGTFLDLPASSLLRYSSLAESLTMNCKSLNCSAGSCHKNSET